MNSFLLWNILIFSFIFFHLIMRASPIGSLFFFLFFIISIGIIILWFNFTYLGFLLISIYGGAIVVLFLLVSMLFNKKKVIKKKE